jgi:putative membrane protein
VNRETQGAVLLLVGLAVLYASLTDLYLRYVKSGLRPLLLVAAVVLIAAAVATFWRELRPARTTRVRAAGHPNGDGPSHREPRISWLLMLPVFALLVAAPPALGSYAANRSGTALQPPPAFAELPAGDPLQIGLVDYAARAVYDHGRSLANRRFTVTGFVAPGRSGTLYLTRMVLNCCAADAQPIKIGLSGQVPRTARPDTWLEVTGTYTDKRAKDEVNGGTIPFIEVNASRQIPAPHEQYEA